MLYSCREPKPLPARPSGRVSRSLTVDMHCHAWSPEAAALVQPHATAEAEPMAKFGGASRRINAANHAALLPQYTSVDARLAEMEAVGLDVQVISPAPPHYAYWAPVDVAVPAARMVNDFIAGLVEQAPGRFVGLGQIPMQSPEHAVAEMRRCVGELGFRGVELNTNVCGRELAEDAFRPVFAAAEELGCLIFLHPNGFTEGARLTDHYFINLIGNPLDTTVALGHLIFGGVLKDHPGLKILAAHGGGYAGAYPARWDHGHAHRPDCRACIEEPPSTYLKRIFVDTVVYTHAELEALVRQFGADHVLLGTDYPYDMALPDPVAFVETAALTDADKAAILGGNALRLLNLEVTAQ
jgi:aminocarboxymuconate-semialdehyde decarboxylase